MEAGALFGGSNEVPVRAKYYLEGFTLPILHLPAPALSVCLQMHSRIPSRIAVFPTFLNEKMALIHPTGLIKLILIDSQ